MNSKNQSEHKLISRLQREINYFKKIELGVDRFQLLKIAFRNPVRTIATPAQFLLDRNFIPRKILLSFLVLMISLLLVILIFTSIGNEPNLIGVITFSWIALVVSYIGFQIYRVSLIGASLWAPIILITWIVVFVYLSHLL